jgi:hypothetical protein
VIKGLRMWKRRFTEEQITGILKHLEAGLKTSHSETITPKCRQGSTIPRVGPATCRETAVPPYWFREEIAQLRCGVWNRRRRFVQLDRRTLPRSPILSLRARAQPEINELWVAKISSDCETGSYR